MPKTKTGMRSPHIVSQTDQTQIGLNNNNDSFSQNYQSTVRKRNRALVNEQKKDARNKRDRLAYNSMSDDRKKALLAKKREVEKRRSLALVNEQKKDARNKRDRLAYKSMSDDRKKALLAKKREVEKRRSLAQKRKRLKGKAIESTVQCFFPVQPSAIFRPYDSVRTYFLRTIVPYDGHVIDSTAQNQRVLDHLGYSCTLFVETSLHEKGECSQTNHDKLPFGYQNTDSQERTKTQQSNADVLGDHKNTARKRRGRRKFDISNIPTKPSVLPPANPCEYCGAKRFKHETASFCCGEGAISLHQNDPPQELYDLFCGQGELGLEFRKYIRAYNNMMAFTSLGIDKDDSLATSLGTGVYVFKIQGQVHHYIPQLVPSATHGPSYLQLYFYDPLHEVQHRSRIASVFNEKIIEELIRILALNPYSQFFRSLHSLELPTATIVIKEQPSLDPSVYNRPTADDVAFIWRDDADADRIAPRDIVVHGLSHHVYNVEYYYGCYDPLQYPLFLPRGESGWHNGIKKCVVAEGNDKCEGQCDLLPQKFPDGDNFLNQEKHVLQEEKEDKKGFVTIRQYYAYLIQVRPGTKSLILKGGRLLQQYVVDMCVKMESAKLDFIRQHQDLIRAELYQGILEAISSGESDGAKIGRKVVLPATFIGGPRDMRRRYLDAMALVKEFGKPDIFLTMTCNPAWSEIQQELDQGETYQDRPDIVARVFHSKLVELKKDLFEKKIFGPVAAHCFVIEFQKRGLPHAHFLIILQPGSKLRSPLTYDAFVSAELPDPNTQPYLYSLVKHHMMHGPCGVLDPKRTCMKKGKNGRVACKYQYPKAFQHRTDIGDNEYPLYRRSQDGQTVFVRGHELDNRWVVPYNPYLLAKYDCHINVEICSTVQAVKYLYKYIYKGHDKVAYSIVSDANHGVIDEIALYQKGRWVSPVEAMWRIYGFRMYGMQPAVLAMHLHLPNKQLVSYKSKAALLTLAEQEKLKQTMLTEFFKTNATDPFAKKTALLYSEFPKAFVWNNAKRSWRRRKARPNVSRVYTANPMDGEKYYLRLLLSHKRAPTSFEDLRTVDNIQYETFRDAAVACELVLVDNGIEGCLDDSVLYQMPYTLRSVFSSLLAHFNPPNIDHLWNKFELPMSEDFLKSGNFTAEQVRQKVLQAISRSLDGMNKTLQDFGLDKYLADMNVDDLDQNREIDLELAIPVSVEHLRAYRQLNQKQKDAYDQILCSIENDESGVFFIDGPGGTGKTFLYCCLLAAVRSKKQVALATATSGVAASLLPGGRTAHSRFKIPLDTNAPRSCPVSKQNSLGVLIKAAKLIIWDEAAMANKHSIECLDVLLRDIEESPLPFGGKTIVFGGDFRQVLPVILKGTKEESVHASLVNSHLWPLMRVIHLTENMRAQFDKPFANFLMRIGNGVEPENQENLISLPRSMIIPAADHAQGLEELFNFVFPNIRKEGNLDLFKTNCAILTPKNHYVDSLNMMLLDQFPGEFKSFKAFDNTDDPNQQAEYEDILHSFLPSGLPPYDLKLKVNCPAMLLRNINPPEGLCNGTRIICRAFERNMILGEIAAGHNKGKPVMIHRIPLSPPSTESYPVAFKRTQFPLRPSFAMTINKSQGQTLDSVGLYLPQPVFSHGQLYVALSRAKVATSVKVFVAHALDDETDIHMTANVVYKEILHAANVSELPDPLSIIGNDFQ